MSNIVITKRCNHCHEIKPLDEFSKEKNTKDSVQRWCKSCFFNYSKTPRGNKILRAAMKRYRETQYAKQKQIEYNKSTARIASLIRYNQNHPERIQARHAVNNAIRAGDIPRISTQFCFDCGKPAKHYHHYLGYAPKHHLYVRPFCHICHKIQEKSLLA